MEEYIDLHLHTTASDGALTPSELLKACDKEGMSVVSVTDHDSIDAYFQITEKDISEFHGRLITGVELTALYKGELVEVLGYGFDINRMREVIKNITPLEGSLPEQAKIYVDTFLKKGVTLSDTFIKAAFENPEKLFENCRAYSQRIYLDEIRRFPENRAFFKSGAEFESIDVVRFTREYIYNPKSSLYVDLSPLFLSFGDAVDIIHGAGGKAFLAHVFVYSHSVADDLENMVRDYPLDGIECRYPTFTESETRFITEFCESHGLLCSAGSDFHGLTVKPNNFIGKVTNGERTEKRFAKWL